MTLGQALSYVEEQGVVLVSAKGPVPRMTEFLAQEPIKGSWWNHPKSREIYAVLQALEESSDILVCRLVEGKVSFVHRRLWAALARVADRFPPQNLAQIHQEHTATGRHVNRLVPFPHWVDADALAKAQTLDEQGAIAALGAWTTHQPYPL
jgi:hypothetical protein